MLSLKGTTITVQQPSTLLKPSGHFRYIQLLKFVWDVGGHYIIKGHNAGSLLSNISGISSCYLGERNGETKI